MTRSSLPLTPSALFAAEQPVVAVRHAAVRYFRPAVEPPDLPAYVLALDPGTSTGLALAGREPLRDGRGPWRWLALRTLPLHRAIPLVLQALEDLGPERLLVLVEDARLVKYGTAAVRTQGAGSVKRDCAIWEAALADAAEELALGPRLVVRFVKPGGRWSLRKVEAGKLALVTGCTLAGSVHARDAAALAWEHFLHEPIPRWASLHLLGVAPTPARSTRRNRPKTR